MVPLVYCLFNVWILIYTVVNRPVHVMTGLAFLALGSLCYLWLKKGPSPVTTLPLLAIVMGLSTH
jgi:hypothetical protein